MKLTNSFAALLPRRKTRVVDVGGVGIGGDNPIRVQTMTNTDTLDIAATVAQIKACVKAGSELIRITTPTPKHAQALGPIREALLKDGITVPLIADIHFLPAAAFEALKWADKVRLNPGNLFDGKIFRNFEFNDQSYAVEIARIEESLLPFIEAAKQSGKVLRIGSNHGSLSDRILSRFGDTPVGMVEATMEYLRIFKKHDFNDIVVALKSSNPLVMIESNRLLIATMDKEGMDYPIHLGVTEAGNGEEGRAKSTLGIGTLLMEGIGDTIRVSLTEDPAKEIPTCYGILQATHRRITRTEFISCPSCGRTLFDIEPVTNTIKERMGHLKGLHIAIMGCIVNGLGEMADADYGYVGGAHGQVSLYRKKELVKRNVPEKDAVGELINLIKSDGKWVEAQ
ncbi:MAG: 4-hydroxy-3-methylbut-2-en-1-yl diphosphate synthase [Candidatus Moranbacteria bacterium RIFCSPLOWO2_02_FULL_48_19]|nr:MAG: 4-hydroxy-3-methylbut-2-en-1-yl diphosphate synthase [Candidatus Moranbacteria bacterium RIFCSPLOWO2_02_FULL_48_19]OGI30770.1 MAG: 4-hydroxy-3-methylbut-2-en-1-yl diphosphate synthase [Candidatus Moranbacteria bacterium RIFCSPLOWO2_12_FULL_48_12]